MDQDAYKNQNEINELAYLKVKERLNEQIEWYNQKSKSINTVISSV
ncbi:hypothetical protein OGZ37_09560 [Lactococcus lactis]|nr:hypothetical protein [Lactococcus lactis]MDG4966817.1 hypothetical protein [Lactococcus lactis]